MKYIARIRNDYIRGLLLFLVFPASVFFGLILPALFDDQKRQRLNEPEFWSMMWNMFWLAFEGGLVGLPIVEE